MNDIAEPDPVTPERVFLSEDAQMPNNPDLPVLLYRGVLAKDAAEDLAEALEARFSASGWGGTWRNGIYAFHHFHPDAHEALGVARGRARVRLGGEGGHEFAIEAGDLVVLPAGTGHKLLEASPDFLVVGAYPPGQEDFETLRAAIPRERLRAVALPGTDPVYGEGGPLVLLWGRSPAGAARA